MTRSVPTRLLASAAGRVTVAALLLASAGGATFAMTAKGSPNPTLTAFPPSASSSTSATFAFTGPNGASFHCALDAAAFTSCTSPKSYTGLAQGSHTFRVRATSGNQTGTTTYSWVVDTTPPPAPAITGKPAALSTTTSPTFTFSSTENGVQFRCSLDSGAPAACGSPKAYSGLAQGGHTFTVRAIDAAGNPSAPSTWSWMIDSIAPPAPVITQKPSDPTPNATNTFAWTTSSGAAYQCSFENGPWTACSTPLTYVINTDNNTQHQFAVRAVDPAGNASAAAEYVFKYDKLQPEQGVPFDISGDVTGLTMGLWKPITVTIENPNTAAIYVRSITVTASEDSTPTGCPSADHLEIEQADVSETDWVLVPALDSVVLSEERGPRIRLRNLPINQDFCKGKSFELTYSGTASN